MSFFGRSEEPEVMSNAVLLDCRHPATGLGVKICTLQNRSWVHVGEVLRTCSWADVAPSVVVSVGIFVVKLWRRLFAGDHLPDDAVSKTFAATDAEISPATRLAAASQLAVPTVADYAGSRLVNEQGVQDAKRR